jgi:hypothetical protein
MSFLLYTPYFYKPEKNVFPRAVLSFEAPVNTLISLKTLTLTLKTSTENAFLQFHQVLSD